MRSLRLRAVLIGALFSLTGRTPVPAAASAPGDAKAVLLVHAEDPYLPWVGEISAGIYEALEVASPPLRPDIYVEHLDLARFPDPGHAPARAAWLRDKYRGLRIDAILAITKSALDVVAPLAGEFWPGVPIVLIENERVVRNFSFPEGVTRVLGRFEIAETLDLARTLLPGTRRVAFVSGAPDYEPDDAENFRQDFAARADGLELIELVGLPMAELEERIASLPEDTIVFYWGIRLDGAGRSYVPREALRQFAPSSNRPIFSVHATMLGFGMIGGRLLSYQELGKQGGRTALRILGGLSGSSTLPPSGSVSRTAFDDRELRRFDIPESRLPAGSEVLFRDLSFWQRYPGITAAVVAALLVQGALIAALLLERRRRGLAQALSAATLASLPGQVAVLDGSGRIVQVNENWASLGAASAAGGVPIGDSYLDVWRRAVPAAAPAIARALDLLEGILQGRRDQGMLEYSMHDAGRDRWFEMHVEVLTAPGKGAVVVQVDTTSRHEAAAEARRRDGEIAHLNRVGAVGELASSLAHELNQPLAAILANAQAARRLLSRETPDLAEVRASLHDIIEDDQRAGDVILRIRSLLRKEATPRTDVDLNEVVRGVVLLVTTDAHLRKASVEPELAAVLPPVRGDSVQLKQVVLNLVVNGLDAVGERPPHERVVRVRTEAVAGNVELSISDSGTGIADRDLDRVFEPFYTTKAGGLGMGLPICRSIVEAHDGRLLVESVLGQGATFRCRIPAGAS